MSAQPRPRKSSTKFRDHLAGRQYGFRHRRIGGGTGTVLHPSSPGPRATSGISPSRRHQAFHLGPAPHAHAEAGIAELHKVVRYAPDLPKPEPCSGLPEKTPSRRLRDADQVLYSGVACITDLMVKEGLINLDSPTSAP